MKLTDFQWVLLVMVLIARAVETHADDKLPTTNKADRPNIILIMADDVGYECFGEWPNGTRPRRRRGR